MDAAYDGPGKTTVSILNENKEKLMVDGYSQQGIERDFWRCYIINLDRLISEVLPLNNSWTALYLDGAAIEIF